MPGAAGQAEDFVVQREQVDENNRYSKLAAIATIFNTCVAVAAVWDSHFIWPLGAWGVCMVALAFLRIRAAVTSALATPGEVAAKKRMIEFIAMATGINWGVGVVLIAAVATPTQYIIASFIAAGNMGASATTYTSLSRAAHLFVTPIAVGGLISLWIPDFAPSVAGSLILACYAVVLINGASRREQRFCERVRAKLSLEANAETIRLLLNDFESQAADWLWQVDGEGRIRLANERFAQAAGRGAELLEGSYLPDLFEPGRERDMLGSHLQLHHRFRHLTIKLTIDGSPRWWTLTGQPSADGGMRGVASDVTAQKRAEEQVSHMAHYDGLTDLANRFLFNETLGRAIKRRQGAAEIAVLCLDLDSFKSVNDTLGHPAGDKLLIETARRIEACVRPDDLVARLGGDEFAVLIKGKNAVAEAKAISERILASLSEPIDLDGHQIMSSTSIGIAAMDEGANEASLLMKRADLALYAAKEAGRNRLALYEDGMDEAAQARRQLEMDLRAALVSGEFELHYQPLINLQTGETTAFEALVRWNHPRRGIVMPDDFIPLAEETGLIVQLGEWVIRNACSEVAHWPEHLHVSVNLSPAQMRSSALIGTVFNAVASAGIAPERLQLEITETVLMHDSEVNLATLHKLRDFGVRIALDDFGTGYSSLNYLRSFPFDKIKIDKCFISEIEDNSDCQAIVHAVVTLANNLGMETTAEGVESSEQLQHLRDKGCTEAQGYLFSRPERAEQFTDLRRAQSPTAATGNIVVPTSISAEAAKRSAGSR